MRKTRLVRISDDMVLRLRRYQMAQQQQTNEQISLVRASQLFAQNAITTEDDIKKFIEVMKKHRLR